MKGEVQSRSVVVARNAENGASVTGKAAPDGTFALTLALEPGQNGITLTSTDPAGNESEVVISLVRALSYNGLGNAFHLAAINGGRHVAPTFAGDTIYAWSEIIEKAEIPERRDIGALRVRMVGVKNQDCAAFPLKTEAGEYAEGVVLDLDTWLVLPR